MAKKRVIKKRVQKRKVVVKSSTKPSMSKLEYEQSMMDPRFRAAMTGFNQPIPVNQQMNHMIDDINKRIGDNNKLVNQINQINEVNNLKAEKKRLQEQLDDQQRRRQYEDTINKNTEEIINKKHELLIAEINKGNQKQLQELLAATNKLNRDTDLTSLLNQHDEKLLNAQQEKMKAEINSIYSPLIQSYEMQSAEIKRKLDEVNQKAEKIKELKNAHAELTKAQIESINAPIIHALQSQKNELENIKRINQTIFDEQQNRARLESDVAVLRQEIDPKQMREHEAQVREERLKTVPVINQKRLLNEVNAIKLDNEKMNRNIIELGVQAFGEDFNPDEIGSDVLTQKIKTSITDLQKKKVNLAAQKETIDVQIRLKKEQEQAERDNQEAQARLEVIKNHSSEYNQSIHESAKAAAMLREETDRLVNINKQLQDMKDSNAEGYMIAVEQLNDVMNQHPFIRKVAQEVSDEENPDPRCLPDLLESLKAINTSTINCVKNFDPQYLVSGSGLDENLRNTVLNANEVFIQNGFYTWKERTDMGAARLVAEENLARAIEEKNQAMTEKQEMQERLKQSDKFLASTYIKSTMPITEDGKFYSGGLGDDPNNINRQFPDGKSAMRMTQDNFYNLLGSAGMNDDDLINAVNNTSQ